MSSIEEEESNLLEEVKVETPPNPVPVKKGVRKKITAKRSPWPIKFIQTPQVSAIQSPRIVSVSSPSGSGSLLGLKVVVQRPNEVQRPIV